MTEKEPGTFDLDRDEQRILRDLGWKGLRNSTNKPPRETRVRPSEIPDIETNIELNLMECK